MVKLLYLKVTVEGALFHLLLVLVCGFYVGVKGALFHVRLAFGKTLRRTQYYGVGIESPLW